MSGLNSNSSAGLYPRVGRWYNPKLNTPKAGMPKDYVHPVEVLVPPTSDTTRGSGFSFFEGIKRLFSRAQAPSLTP